MEASEIQKRVADLEQEVAALKKAVQVKAEPAGKLGKLSGFLKENWVLLSFISTLLIAGWGKFHYKVAYFEKYETAKTNRELSDFHTLMGDRFLGLGERESAKQAYAEAMKINPDNQRAVWGNELAQVFDPPPGEKEWTPDVVDARLDYLSENKDFGNDYRLDFLKAIRYQAMGDDDQAMTAIQKCFDKKGDKTDKFLECYLERGYIEVSLGRPDLATADFNSAYDRDHPSFVVLNDIAACELLSTNFAGAHQDFEKSNRMSPKILTSLNLGESDWFLRDFAGALNEHQWAANYLDGPVTDNDRLLGYEWTEPYFPLKSGDHETIRNSVHIYTAKQKRTTLHFALAIDHALLNDTADANDEFATAMKLQPNPDHRKLIQNRMESVEKMVQMSPAARDWLETHRKKLDSGTEAD